MSESSPGCHSCSYSGARDQLILTDYTERMHDVASRLRVILFVCTGNICRSPMAAGLLARHVGSEPGLNIQSAGIQGVDGKGAHPLALEEMRKRGVDLSDHRARTVSPDLLTKSDLILTMEQVHKFWIETRMPTVRGRVYLLGHGRNAEIHDPVNGAGPDFERVADQLDAFLMDWQHALYRSNESEQTRQSQAGQATTD